MAVPSTAYYRNATVGLAARQKTGGVETETVILLVVLATAYPDEATIKSLFYLDWIKEKVREKVGGVEVVGYACGVLMNGENKGMRNANKLSGLREVVKLTGVSETREYMLLTNPLSTYANVLFGIGYKFDYPVTVEIYVKSAFYHITTSYGFEYKINSGAVHTADYGAIPANGLVDFDEKELDFELGDYVEIRAFATNEEGISIGEWKSAYVRPELYYFRYDRIDNNDGTVTFSVTLYPIALEFNLSVVFEQTYSGSSTKTYCTVTILAGQTTASNNMALVGTPLNYGVNYYTPLQAPDLTPIEDHGEIAQKWRIKISLFNEYEKVYMVYISVEGDAGNPAVLPEPIDIALFVTGQTESGHYGEYFYFYNITESPDPDTILLNYEDGDSIWDLGLSATSTPTHVDGMEVVFIYIT